MTTFQSSTQQVGSTNNVSNFQTPGDPLTHRQKNLKSRWALLRAGTWFGEKASKRHGVFITTTKNSLGAHFQLKSAGAWHPSVPGITHLWPAEPADPGWCLFLPCIALACSHRLRLLACPLRMNRNYGFYVLGFLLALPSISTRVFKTMIMFYSLLSCVCVCVCV